MKKILYSMVVGLTMLLASCTIETSDNGDLDGLWQLTAIDTLATGGHADMRASDVTWSVQGRLLEFRWVSCSYICKFTYEDNHLLTGDIRVLDRDSEDPLVTDVKAPYEKFGPYPTMADFGVNQLPEDFKVVTLTSGTMVLESSLLRLHFRKY